MHYIAIRHGIVYRHYSTLCTTFSHGPIVLLPLLSRFMCGQCFFLLRHDVLSKYVCANESLI